VTGVQTCALPILYNAIIITVEDEAADPETPGEEIAYSGSAPLAVSTALREIFIESGDGLDGNSLLDGIILEAETATRHAGLASTSDSVISMHTHAEHTINILNGTEIDHDGDGNPANPGRGVGVYAFADLIATQLDNILNADGVSQQQAVNTEFIRVCIDNARVRADRVIELEEDLLASDTLEGVEEEADESELIAGQIVTGVDLNEDGTIDPFEGECGLQQISTFGIATAQLRLFEGGLE